MINVLRNYCRKKFLLINCLFISISFHFLLLSLFYRHPLILKNSFASLFKTSSPTLELIAQEDFIKKNDELAEVFQKIETSSPSLEQPFDLRYQPSDLVNQPHQEAIQLALSSEQAAENLAINPPAYAFQPVQLAPVEITDSLISSEDNPFETITQIELVKLPSNINLKELTAATDLSLDYFEEERSPFDDSLPVLTAIDTNTSGRSVIESVSDHAIPQLTLPKDPDALQICAKPLDIKHEISAPEKALIPQLSSPLQKEDLALKQIKAMPVLNDYLFPEIPNPLEWNNQFDAKIEMTAHPEGKGYVFELNLNASQESIFQSIPQNFYFLVDRCGSIEKHRFSVFKKAVIKALACLQEGDKFNVIFCDKKVVKLSEKTLPFSKLSLQAAEEFIEKQEHSGLFASGDIFANLEKVMPTEVNEDEIHTAILITDGQSKDSAAWQQKNIRKWMDKNKGRVSLNTAAVARENNLLMLDLLSSCNGGELMYSDTFAAFPRRLGKLVLNLRQPILKEPMISAIPKDPDLDILFYPSSAHLPNFHQHRPFEVMGTMGHLSDFTLVVQGKYKNQWVTIKKDISFKKAGKGDKQLEKKWTNQMAKQQYNHFLKEGKVAHLSKAKELLKSTGAEIAFE